MGKYSLKGSATFDALIDSHMERIAEAVYGSSFSKHWKALVLLGGYGRGEGTPHIKNNGDECPFNDYDLIVVTTTINPLVKKALRALEESLTKELGLPVDLYPYLEKNLPKCEFSLLNYEMKYGHKVIRGDQEILSKMPAYPHDRIPLSEGTRLLMNRGKLLLDIKCRLAQPEPLSAEEHHRFIKFIFKANLAFGDCALLLRDAYDISYAVKKERIQTLNLNGLPNAAATIEAYRKAVEFKERALFQTLETANIHMWFDETAKRFEEVFLWYERRRLNRKFRNIKKYTHSFPNLGNEGSALKNILRNLSTFGFSALPDLTTHPRLRLYASVPLLLAPQADRDDLRWLLCSREGAMEGLCADFVALQKRFS